MKKILIAAVILVFSALILIFWLGGKKGGNANDKISFPLETQVLSDGPVTISVTPQDVAAGTFEVTLNTHSVELDDDLTQKVILRDETGREYKPLGWEGSPPGGHHREGVLSFGSLSQKSRKIELIFNDIGGIPEQKLLWIINP